MWPGVDEVVELRARTGSLADVAVPFEGVGGGDLVVVQPALDQLADSAQGGGVGYLVGEVANDADSCSVEGGEREKAVSPLMSYEPYKGRETDRNNELGRYGRASGRTVL